MAHHHSTAAKGHTHSHWTHSLRAAAVSHTHNHRVAVVERHSHRSYTHNKLRHNAVAIWCGSQRQWLGPGLGNRCGQRRSGDSSCHFVRIGRRFADCPQRRIGSKTAERAARPHSGSAMLSQDPRWIGDATFSSPNFFPDNSNETTPNPPATARGKLSCPVRLFSPLSKRVRI